MSLPKKICVGLLLVFVGIQFIRPSRNLSAATPGPKDATVLYPASPEVKAILARACYDCHSDNTRYPWYANVQPAAWWLAHHVNEGKRELNFSHFGEYPPVRAARKLTKTIDETKDGEMPLWSYTLIHRDARLAPDEIAALADWARTARARVPGHSQ